jgi:hypothetical protein
VTLGRGQQEDLSVGIADEIEVSHDLERLGAGRNRHRRRKRRPR